MAARMFSLCIECAIRQGGGEELREVEAVQCFICQGLATKAQSIEQKVLRLIKTYEFRTFSLGMIIPSDIQEREDQLRSELQIRGGETFKSQMSRKIASHLSRKIRRKVDRGHPEITILVDLRTHILSISAKSLFIHGRYTKPRGASQKKELCDKCGGAGCHECELGYSKVPSIENVLGGRLVKITKASDIKFTWLGSEDTESIVYAPGRPFVAEIRNPKIRHLPKAMNLATGKGSSRVLGMKVLKGRPRVFPSFVFMTRAFIEPLQGIPEDLKPVKKMRGVMVEYRNNKGKAVFRKVYSVKITKKAKLLIAEVKLGGGLPVKRLVSGESTSPSLSEVLKTPLKCQRFDILRVWESGSFEFGKI